MKKKVILLSLAVIILAACFIPVTLQKTVLVKASFFNIYDILANPNKWEKWQPDLRAAFTADSTKISIKKDTSSFVIKAPTLELNVKTSEGAFDVDERSDHKNVSYSYTVMPENKVFNGTFITVSKKVSAIKYLIERMAPVSFEDTHINDIKNFMETDSLRYGAKIFKVRIPESYLITVTKEVIAKDKLAEAAKLLTDLRQYVNTHNVKQMQPMIAQFLKAGKDSTQIKVGFFIDKEVASHGDVIFTRMPKGGPLYAAKFTGKFNQRQIVYAGLHQYFTDHLYQSAILPFETYFDNKFPVTDTDKVNIQVNFSTYF